MLICNAIDWRAEVAKHEVLAKAARPMWKNITGCPVLWNKMKVNGRKKGRTIGLRNKWDNWVNKSCGVVCAEAAYPLFFFSGLLSPCFKFTETVEWIMCWMDLELIYCFFLRAPLSHLHENMPLPRWNDLIGRLKTNRLTVTLKMWLRAFISLMPIDFHTCRNKRQTLRACYANVKILISPLLSFILKWSAKTWPNICGENL